MVVIHQKVPKRSFMPRLLIRHGNFALLVTLKLGEDRFLLFNDFFSQKSIMVVMHEKVPKRSFMPRLLILNSTHILQMSNLYNI